MDEEKKKQLNDAIAVIRSFCLYRDSCTDCPFAYNCDATEYGCASPWDWQDIE